MLATCIRIFSALKSHTTRVDHFRLDFFFFLSVCRCSSFFIGSGWGSLSMRRSCGSMALALSIPAFSSARASALPKLEWAYLEEMCLRSIIASAATVRSPLKSNSCCLWACKPQNTWWNCHWDKDAYSLIWIVTFPIQHSHLKFLVRSRDAQWIFLAAFATNLSYRPCFCLDANPANKLAPSSLATIVLLSFRLGVLLKRDDNTFVDNMSILGLNRRLAYNNNGREEATSAASEM